MTNDIRKENKRAEFRGAVEGELTYIRKALQKDRDGGFENMETSVKKSAERIIKLCELYSQE